MNPQTPSFVDSLMVSLTSAFAMLFAAVPRIIGFLVILAIGWLVASLIEKGIVAVLRAVRFDSFVERAGLAGVMRTVKREPAAVLGAIAKWFVRLIVLVVAFDALGVPAVSQVLHQLLMWLPNLAVALVVLVIGGIAANALGDVVGAAAARGRLQRPDVLALVAKWSVWTFAILVAVNQIGVASTLVDILFMALVGAAALAVGLSFGLGARDTAGSIVREFYDRNRRGRATLVGQARSAANEAPRVPYTGIEHRHAVADRRINPNGRRAAT